MPGVESDPKSFRASAPPTDALDYLRCSTIARFGKKARIFDHDQPASGLYLIIDGIVKVSSVLPTGEEVVLDLYGTDEFFGESALVGNQRQEQAVPLQDAAVMQWSVAEVEEQILKEPRLGVALVQMLFQRSLELQRRIESLAAEGIEQRLARSLIRLSERLGTEEPSGAIGMIPLTHEVLAQYVGTSREIVTNYMNRFRRSGYLAYSRRGMSLQAGALKQWLAAQGRAPRDPN